jgi:hypothetical protein
VNIKGWIFHLVQGPEITINDVILLHAPKDFVQYGLEHLQLVRIVGQTKITNLQARVDYIVQGDHGRLAGCVEHGCFDVCLYAALKFAKKQGSIVKISRRSSPIS